MNDTSEKMYLFIAAIKSLNVEAYEGKQFCCRLRMASSTYWSLTIYAASFAQGGRLGSEKQKDPTAGTAFIISLNHHRLPSPLL